MLRFPAVPRPMRDALSPMTQSPVIPPTLHLSRKRGDRYEISNNTAPAAGATKFKRKRVRINGDREQISFLNWSAKKRYLGETMTDSDLITTFSYETFANTAILARRQNNK